MHDKRTFFGITSAVLTVLLLSQPCLGKSYDASVPAPTHRGVSYGEHARNVMDVWLAQADTPRPAVFVIHGGGWRGGSKELLHRFVNVSKLLDQGISVVAINYRLISKEQSSQNTASIDLNEKPPVHTPLHDAARALQFLRSKADQWNIDPERIAAAGGSAGACSSLWLAFHDDLADPDSADPVARQSTRLFCAAVQGAQTTLDPKQMKAWIPNSKYGGHAFGLETFDRFLAKRDEIMPWIKAYSPYHHVSADDPPIFLLYFGPPAVGEKQRDPTHSTNFGVKLQEHCRAKGVDCALKYPGDKNAKYSGTTAFLIDKLLSDEAR